MEKHKRCPSIAGRFTSNVYLSYLFSIPGNRINLSKFPNADFKRNLLQLGNMATRNEYLFRHPNRNPRNNQRMATKNLGRYRSLHSILFIQLTFYWTNSRFVKIILPTRCPYGACLIIPKIYHSSFKRSVGTTREKLQFLILKFHLRS